MFLCNLHDGQTVFPAEIGSGSDSDSPDENDDPTIPQSVTRGRAPMATTAPQSDIPQGVTRGRAPRLPVTWNDDITDVSDHRRTATTSQDHPQIFQ